MVTNDNPRSKKSLAVANASARVSFTIIIAPVVSSGLPWTINMFCPSARVRRHRRSIDLAELGIQRFDGLSAHFFRVSFIDGNGAPSLRARTRRPAAVRRSAAAAFITDTPRSTKSRSFSSSASVQGRVSLLMGAYLNNRFTIFFRRAPPLHGLRGFLSFLADRANLVILSTGAALAVLVAFTGDLLSILYTTGVNADPVVRFA